MSLAAIRNALFAHFTASGPFTASEISTCTFDVLESVSGSCLTFFPEGVTEIEPLAFGTGGVTADKRNWRIGGTLWIRDTGNPLDVLSRIWQSYDDLYSTLHKDPGLGGTADQARLTTISHNRDRFMEIHGHLWKPVEWVVVAEEY